MSAAGDPKIPVYVMQPLHAAVCKKWLLKEHNAMHANDSLENTSLDFYLTYPYVQLFGVSIFQTVLWPCAGI